VYVSQDVIFNENVFPFVNLHPNAGAHIRDQILLLPPNLLNPGVSDQGGEILVDHMTNPSNPDTNTGENSDPSCVQIPAGNRHEIIAEQRNGANDGIEVDLGDSGVGRGIDSGGTAIEVDSGAGMGTESTSGLGAPEAPDMVAPAQSHIDTHDPTSGTEQAEDPTGPHVKQLGMNPISPDLVPRMLIQLQNDPWQVSKAAGKKNLHRWNSEVWLFHIH
jgi:hypothetical protein